MKLSDMTVGFLIIGVILMFIIPIPSPMLDILLALNISVSLVILLNTVYAKEPLEMSITQYFLGSLISPFKKRMISSLIFL